MIRKCFDLALTFFRCLFQGPFFIPTTIRQKNPESVLAKKGRDSAKDGREGRKERSPLGKKVRDHISLMIDFSLLRGKEASHVI